MTVATDASPFDAAVKRSAGSPLSDSIGGIIAIVLTILGLVRLAPVPLVAIATIAVAVAVLIQGQAVARYYARTLAAPSAQAVTSAGGSWAIGVLAGAAGIILGVLALLQLQPISLVAIAAIVLGSAFVFRANFGTPATASAEREGADLTSQWAAIQALTGLAAVVLGILALAGFVPVILVLVAFLTLGGGLLVNSATFGGLLLALFRRG